MKISRIAIIFMLIAFFSVSIFQISLGSLAKKPAKKITKSITISLTNQTLSCFANGKKIRSMDISSGKHGFATPKGSFFIHDKVKNEYSITYKVAMPYCHWISDYVIGIHAGKLPGYPASHGCIRLYYHDAQWLFGWTRIGTKVTIY